MRARAALLASLVATALLPLAAPTAPAAASARVLDYDLGVVELPDEGPKGPIPVRLWGAIGVPDGPGPFPVVVVAHGRHGDGCPVVSGHRTRWPCWKTELRSDLGMRHLVAALARRGVAAIAPDLNAAFTIGWNDPTGERRLELWPAIVDRTLAALREAATGAGPDFGLQLEGRLDLARPGFLAHSLSGAEAVRYSDTHPVSSLLLLAPAYEKGPAMPPLEVAIVAARCDYDVPGQARRWFDRARRRARRPLFLVRLEGASHNYFNSTLADEGRDDGAYLRGSPGCRPRERLSAVRQQHWIDRFGASYFATELRGAPRPRWMRLQGPSPGRLYGTPVGYDRFVPALESSVAGH